MIQCVICYKLQVISQKRKRWFITIHELITRQCNCGANFTLRLGVYYRPQRSCGKVMFLNLSFCPQGGCLLPPGQTPLPWADTPQAENPPLLSACWYTVNKRAVRILLECIVTLPHVAIQLYVRRSKSNPFQLLRHFH